MARGDQRERDRAKKQARLAKEGRNAPKDGRPEQRNANDAAALAAKVAKKAEMKQQQEADSAKAASNKPVVRKKTGKKKEAENLDDLLSAGLSAGKGKKK
mmetsp:Transcript_17942/g.30955  ORF Transcript_17942/g.30955 Transcript_17942/m.30955 type:complete len:100 (+) Transcript_17942:147-446(+)|eukprot:CAMPEP_0183703842 /NCGR_PEP_ID=MMETSP0737-20130205/1422_1 /TAXON_ID=385413 /ORGANISM="Thalassiosira miniscula, Strain CCMP1093" /LENGTH=99 /DNA_ID=CAMNT_0025930639 /DNA_START=88 /DNA_END=387 /DNA_ORIENTATION=-